LVGPVRIMLQPPKGNPTKYNELGAFLTQSFEFPNRLHIVCRRTPIQAIASQERNRLARQLVSNTCSILVNEYVATAKRQRLAKPIYNLNFSIVFVTSLADFVSLFTISVLEIEVVWMPL